MANPIIVNVPADTWTKIATSKTRGLVHILNPTDKNWYQTFVDTGDPAPTDEPEVKLNFQTDKIKNSVLIDVYAFHKNTAGRVRVDL